MCCVWLKNCTVAIVSLRPNAETWSNKTFNKGVICYQVNLTCLFFSVRPRVPCDLKHDLYTVEITSIDTKP